MLLLKVAPIFLLALLVRAEKKIELQDIEEDNLKSEKHVKYDKEEDTEDQTTPEVNPLDYLKGDIIRYLQSTGHGQQQAQAPQQPRYIQQYAVTEQPEQSIPPPKSYMTSSPHGMVGYLSNIPMQIYLVPQYYNEVPTEQGENTQHVQYTSSSQQRVQSYPTAPEPIQPQSNYVEVPTYVAPSGKAYIHQYQTPVTYVYQPTGAPAPATVSPVVAYQMPVVQYQTAIVAPPLSPKAYYHSNRYTDTNSVDDAHEEDGKRYSPSTETTYQRPSVSSHEYPRYYSSRTPIREEHRSPTSELPPPSPLLLKGAPAHLAHLPKALPVYRPINKPIYSNGGSFISSAYTPKPSEVYGVSFKRRPTSLLDSYIPSGIQIEYLKRGLIKDPLTVYETLSSGRHLSHPVIPKHYERGFLPNQMYHTAGGGITYGHYKRTPKAEKISQK